MYYSSLTALSLRPMTRKLRERQSHKSDKLLRRDASLCCDDFERNFSRFADSTFHPLCSFFQVAVNRWPVTKTWAPAVSVPPAGRRTRGARRPPRTGPRPWWCFPVTPVAPFEIIWDARPCFPSGCAVSDKERAKRKKMRRKKKIFSVSTEEEKGKCHILF